jgi:YidC/Oxa1 family membrane protein insertase
VEQRRLLIAFVVSLVLVVAYQQFVLSRYRRPEPATRGAVSTTTMAPAAAAPTVAAGPSGVLSAPLEGGVVVVETDVLRATLSSAGARLADVQLKAYRRTVDPDSEPLDLVQRGDVLPGTIQLDQKSSDAGIRYEADRTELVLSGADQGEVVFSADTQAGLHVEKRYRFSGNGYLFDVTVDVKGEHVSPSVGLLVTPVAAETRRGGSEVAVALANPTRRLLEKPILELQKQPIPVESPIWAGFAAQYFMSVAIPHEGSTSAVFTMDDGVPIARVDAPVVDGRASFSIYEGPKDRDTLARANHDLDRALDFGWFWFVAIPLLSGLRALSRVTGNYGVAIIVLTAAVKVVTAPLTRTTFRNMREMQKIQPQMAKLRERFKDDQAALQKEMMELYRRHRVNPFSGCLPMLLQLPIFVGLYNALSHAIELRHAHFALWINDLSAPDRLYIAGVGIPVLTLLMGVSMFVQQWLTPQQGDPTQQRMMMFMPLLFTFMFINFPAGLVLYWLVNNILTIAQQYLMMRTTA